MKKVYLLSSLLVLLAAMPADAQILRRPIFRKLWTSPVVQELVNFGVSQVLPNLPALPDLGSREPRIMVDSSVSRNLEVTTDNLREARSTIEELLVKNELKAPPPKKKDVKVKTKE
jgi:hypothetical protein